MRWVHTCQDSDAAESNADTGRVIEGDRWKVAVTHVTRPNIVIDEDEL